MTLYDKLCINIKLFKYIYLPKKYFGLISFKMIYITLRDNKRKISDADD